MLIVDRSCTATSGRIVLVRINGETLVRRLEVNSKKGWLIADNPDFPAIELKEGLDYRILGVVRHRIHAV
jgi:DNA polymerase V